MTENEVKNDIEDLEDLEGGSLAEDIAKLKEQENKEPESEPEEEKAEEVQTPTEEEKLNLKKAQEDYKKRQEERRLKQLEQQQQKHVEQAAATINDTDKEAIEFIKQFQKQQILERNIKQAEVELSGLEGEFRVAYPDYDDKVKQAMKLTKYRLVNEGMSELEAEQLLKREKVLLADKAAAQGKDPVEAVYNEAKAILDVFEKYAEEVGYTKKKKTNLQALREASKPNAMSGGAGRGAVAAKRTYEDMEGDEIDELSIGQLLNGGI